MLPISPAVGLIQYYLRYALALAADGNTDIVYADNVINAISGGRRGAILLNLVDETNAHDAEHERFYTNSVSSTR